MKKLIFCCVLILFVILPISAEIQAGGPPPIGILDGTRKVRPSISIPGYRGPSVGIEVVPYSKKGVSGILVRRDIKKKYLWYLGPNRQPKSARFATNRDVILKVNDKPVKSASDVLANTYPTWNKLTIKDLGTRITADYFVELP